MKKAIINQENRMFFLPQHPLLQRWNEFSLLHLPMHPKSSHPNFNQFQRTKPIAHISFLNFYSNSIHLLMLCAARIIHYLSFIFSAPAKYIEIAFRILITVSLHSRFRDSLDQDFNIGRCSFFACQETIWMNFIRNKYVRKIGVFNN